MNEIPKSQPIFSKHNADWKKLLEREYIKPYTTHVKFKKKKLSPNILYVVTYIHIYVENVQKHSQERNMHFGRKLHLWRGYTSDTRNVNICWVPR